MLCGRLDGEVLLLHEARWDDQEEALRAAAREKRVLAPCCGAPLVVKWGLRVARHFAHPPRHHCPFDRWHEPESAEHVAGKALLYEWCRRQFSGRIRVLQMEFPLKETLQRPDLYLELDDGSRYALEYQRSAISLVEWTARHKAYAGLGIQDIWIMGENRLQEALPSAAQQERWSRKEPKMLFLGLRAFEAAAALRTPFETAWWRGEQQEELWAPQELDARVGREVFPWYRRSALERLASVAFLDAAGAGELVIYRGMREFPGHTDTRMASACLRVALDSPGLELTAAGFVTPLDVERLAAFEARRSRLDGLDGLVGLVGSRAGAVEATREAPATYVAPPVRPLPAALPAYFHDAAARRAAMPIKGTAETAAFQFGEQEEEQGRRLGKRAENPEWRRIVDRFGLTPQNLHFLIGVPIPDETAILTHRTVWQAYVYYGFVRQRRGGFPLRQAAQAVERRFGFDPEMARLARYFNPGRLNAPEDVIGAFLNLLVDMGYLRNDFRSEHHYYHAPEQPPEPLAFADRQQRWAAWAGLLSGSVRLAADRRALVGEGFSALLVPVQLEDRPTLAQLQAVDRLAARLGWSVNLEKLTFAEASRLLSKARGQKT
jgi:competence CoiA-like predicted nuclease